MGVLERRYAKALLEAALEKGEAQAVSAGVEALASALEEKKIWDFLAAPVVSKERKLEVLGKLVGGLDGLFGRFLEMVVARRREGALPLICRNFHDLHLEAQGAVEGVVETARPLSEEEVERLSRAMARALGKKKVILEVRERPELLAGARVRVAGRLYDSSAAGRLEALRRRLLGVPL